MIKIKITETTTKNHTTPEEVYKEMQNAIDIGHSNSDPTIKANWLKLGFDHKPTPDEFIIKIASYLSE